MSTGPEKLHYLVEQAFTAGGALSTAFLEGVEPRDLVRDRAAVRDLARADLRAGRGDARGRRSGRWTERGGEPLFFGETIFPWMFEEDPALAGLREAAELLAAKDDWPALYDAERLAKNEIPVVAAVYLEDLYVESAFSLETADAGREPARRG